MRLLLFIGLAFAACTGGCGPKPIRQLSSSDCLTWKCPETGDCVCVGK